MQPTSDSLRKAIFKSLLNKVAFQDPATKQTEEFEVQTKPPILLKRLRKFFTSEEKETSVDLFQLIATTFTEKPDQLLVIGRCVHLQNKVEVFPDPDDIDLSFTFTIPDVVEGPLNFQTTVPELAAENVKAIRVKRGCLMTLTSGGVGQQISLTQPTIPANLCALYHKKYLNTWCKGFLQFECGTNNFLGPCIGFWTCP